MRHYLSRLSFSDHSFKQVHKQILILKMIHLFCRLSDCRFSDCIGWQLFLKPEICGHHETYETYTYLKTKE